MPYSTCTLGFLFILIECPFCTLQNPGLCGRVIIVFFVRSVQDPELYLVRDQELCGTGSTHENIGKNIGKSSSGAIIFV